MTLDVKTKTYKPKSYEIEGFIKISETGLNELGYTTDPRINVVDDQILPSSITNELLRLRPKYVFNAEGEVIGLVNFRTADDQVSESLATGDYTVGAGVSGYNYRIRFDGFTNDGVITWLDASDRFQVEDDLLMQTSERIYFRDTTAYIYSSSAGVLNIGATTLNLIGTTIGVQAAITMDTDKRINFRDANSYIYSEASGYMRIGATRLGFYGVVPVVRPAAYTQNYITTTRTVAAYTTDAESAAYTGIDNLQVGTPYATVADLNALRVAYETLRASHDNLLQVVTQMIDDDQLIGLKQ